jgi:hypothetical protein
MPIPRIGLLLAIALALPGLAAHADEPQPRKHRWMILPSVAFDTDDGFGLGGRFEIQRIDPRITPYRAAFMIQGYATFRGYHHHRFRIDVPGLGPRKQTRVMLYVAFRAWLNDGYWGIGNGTARERAFVGGLEPDDPRTKRYRYQLYQPYLQLNVRKDMAPPFGVFASLVAQYSRVNTYQQSLLGEHRPEGMRGGFAVQFSAGVLADTRAPEVTPERGVYAELSLRASPHFTGSTGPYLGPFAVVRAYVPVATPRVTLATRLMAEWLFGEIPFWEMVRWGGSHPVEGVGGWLTVRGMSFGRWRAPGKAVGNAELRIDVIRHRLFKEPFRWQIVPFADVAAVWGAGEQATATAPAVPLHPTVGIGIHPIWAEAFVGRIDFGFGPDAVMEPDGTITQEPGWGMYLAFDHMY